MTSITKIKVNSKGEQLPADAAEWDAVFVPELSLLYAKSVLPQRLNSDDAPAACAALTLCELSEWRVPSRRELDAIVDLEKSDPAIDTDYFPDTPVGWHLTSTPLAWSSDFVWVVHFGYGDVNGNPRHYKAFVRPVRSFSAGQ